MGCGPLDGCAAHRFDVVAVRIAQACGVIPVVIVPQARCAVVCASGGNRGGEEGVDMGPCPCLKGEVDVPNLTIACSDTKFVREEMTGIAQQIRMLKAVEHCGMETAARSR